MQEEFGFSLVELIFVVMIIGILSLIGLPNAMKYMQETYKKADLVNGTLLAESMLQAVADGHKIKETQEGYQEVNALGVIIDRNQNPVPLNLYISTIPIPKQKGYTHFVYRYTSSGALFIFKVHTDNSMVQVYPMTT